MSKIFISYSHKNKKEAIQVLNALREKGHEVFLDTFFLRAGTNFRPDITAQIKNSDGFLVLITNESRDSDYVKVELGSAMVFHDAQLLLIIPLLKDPPTLDVISDLHHLSIENSLQVDELASIVEKIHRDINDFVAKKTQLIQDKVAANIDAIVTYIENAKKRCRHLFNIFLFLGSFAVLILGLSIWALFANKLEDHETAMLTVSIASVTGLTISLLFLVKIAGSENYLDFVLFKAKTGDYKTAINSSYSSIFFKLDPSVLFVQTKKL